MPRRKAYKAENEIPGGHPVATEEGAAAAAAGKDTDACPYPIDTSPFTRDRWMRAFYSTRRRLAAENGEAVKVEQTEEVPPI